MTRPAKSSAGDLPTFRFAPSPNGLLHAGHAYSAVINQRAAERVDGKLLVRIEDIDVGRARSAFERAILDDLRWLGLVWEEPVLRQSTRLPAYQAALRRLEEFGLVYPSFLSRREIRDLVAQREASGAVWPRDPDGGPVYPGTERDWSAERRAQAKLSGRHYSLRLDMARAIEGLPQLTWQESDPLGIHESEKIAAAPAAWGDIVLARADAPTSYHLAVVVDDAFQGVTDIVRGADLRAATSVHRVLQQLLGLPEPRYRHHRLILDAQGKKLSKSKGAETIMARRGAGECPADILAAIGL